MFGLDQSSTPTSHPEYAKKWKTVMTEAYQLAKQSSQKLAAKNKERYDRRSMQLYLNPVTEFLVGNLSEMSGPGKLRAHWEDHVHVVGRKLGNLPVYEVQPENYDGRTRTIHRNLLLPCNFLLLPAISPHCCPFTYRTYSF